MSQNHYSPEHISSVAHLSSLDIDLIKKCRRDANRLRELGSGHRYATITCFLVQLYHDTVDHLVDMFDKLINKIYTRAQRDVDVHQKSQRKKIRESLETFNKLTDLILDDSIVKEPKQVLE